MSTGLGMLFGGAGPLLAGGVRERSRSAIAPTRCCGFPRARDERDKRMCLLRADKARCNVRAERVVRARGHARMCGMCTPIAYSDLLNIINLLLSRQMHEITIRGGTPPRPTTHDQQRAHKHTHTHAHTYNK